MKDINIMVVDDEKSLLLDIEEYFKSFSLTTFSSPADALNELRKKNYEILIVDYKMPGLSGLELLIEAKKINAYNYGILFSAYIDKPLLETVINRGLIDKIVEKPLKLKILKYAIDKAVAACKSDIKKDNEFNLSTYKYEVLKQQLGYQYDIIGLDKGLKAVFDNIQLVSERFANVLITGETGTGKELAAKLIHDLSERKNQPFIKINCAAVPDSLFESELFGYKKGAFTDARVDKPGKIELANNGTLFLDEIGELKPDLQAKLLRVIQEKKVYRLGDTVPMDVDFHLICATNVNLKNAVHEKLFRKDLFYRIGEFPINLPSLRERRQDIPDLLKHFIKKHSDKYGIEEPGISDLVIHRLTNYKWPGNIREMENIIRQIVIRSKNENEIKLENIEFLLEGMEEDDQPFSDVIRIIKDSMINKKLTLSDIKASVIKEILNHFHGNVTEAVKSTKIKKDQFYKYK